MNVLHTVNSSQALASCSECVSKGDSIILMQDGVYAVIDHCLSGLFLRNDVSIFILADDVTSRGLGGRIPNQFELLSFDGFVQLSCSTDKTVSWF